jgi:hypothetical protein
MKYSTHLLGGRRKRNMASLDIKIQELERKNRILTRAVIILGLVLFMLFLLSAKPAQKFPDEIVARSIRIMNDPGKNSAQIVSTPDGFVGIYFRDIKDELRFGVTMTPSGKTSIDFFGNNRTRLRLGVIDGKEGEEYSLVLQDRDGKPIWQLPVSNPY